MSEGQAGVPPDVDHVDTISHWSAPDRYPVKLRGSADGSRGRKRTGAASAWADAGAGRCRGVHFLGGFGVKEIKGLRVAYLSGRYDLGAWEANPAGARATFRGPASGFS